jgi:hypothetical protein
MQMQTLDAAIEIEASADRVWEVLTDFASYPQWNPFIIRAEGIPVEGARLRISIRAPGYRPVTFKPRILRVVEGRELTWLGRTFLPGLFDGRHSLTVEALDESRARFRSHEEVGGILLPILGKVMRASQEGFEGLCAAVKARAEGR